MTLLQFSLTLRIETVIVKNPGPGNPAKKPSKNQLGQPYFGNKRGTITYNALAKIKETWNMLITTL